jgi:urea ABC transporter permease protein UrtC
MKRQSVIRSIRGPADTLLRLLQTSVGLGRLGSVRLGTVLVLALGVAFPFLVGSFQVSLMVKFLVFAMFALSLDVLWGYGGILSLGHAGFFGLGAYSMALVLIHFQGPGATIVGLLAAVLVPALLAAFLGYFLFYGRVGGMYFAVITLVVSIILNQLVITFIKYTGGLNGLYPIPPLAITIPGLFHWEITGENTLYFSTLVAVILFFLLCSWIVRSGFGRLIRAIKDNETRVEYFGYDLARGKMVLFALCCGLAGLAGGLYAPSIGFISPDLLGIAMTTEVIVWVAVGGKGTLTGAVLGALLVNMIGFFLSGWMVSVWYLIMGAFLVAIVLFRPKGIMGYVSE